jgi:hypothetical protein
MKSADWHSQARSSGLLARFVSADSIVPGAGALKPLTVDFHEPGFGAQLAGENTQAFWFQMSNEERRQVGSPWGPMNPQALNRYSYVQNNPLRYTDPSGHTPKCYEPGCGAEVVNTSNESVEVQGNRYIKGCDVAAHGEACWEYVQVRLDPGESSADYGLTDVDRVRAMSGNTIDGHGHDDVLEVSDGMRVTITSSAPGKQSVASTKCFGSYAWRCYIASMLSPFPLKPAPGWYTDETSIKAKDKWWKEGKAYILPSKRDGSHRGDE